MFENGRLDAGRFSIFSAEFYYLKNTWE